MSTTFKTFLKLTEGKFDVKWSGKSEDDEKLSGTLRVSAVNAEDAIKMAKKKLGKDKDTKDVDLSKGKFSAKEATDESMAISQGNFHQLAGLESDHLKNTRDFEMIKAADPQFAEKLLTAWEGDAREYQRTGKVDSLFLQMVNPKNIEKLSKIKHNAAVEKNLERTAMLFNASMPSKTNKVFVDKSVWKDEPMRMREYVELCTEVKNILTEGKK